jgi:septum formation protein
MTPILLASASPRRRQFLAELGFMFEVRPADVDESMRPGEAAVPYAMRVARTKAMAVAADSGVIVLAADTVVAVDGELFGKPADESDFRRMMARLSGATHEVVTAVAARAGDGRLLERQVSTRVTFRPVGRAEIDWYWATGEPRDKAGGYALQGRAGAFVTRIEGSHTNVIGLPLPETVALLDEAGAPAPWSVAARVA